MQPTSEHSAHASRALALGALLVGAFAALSGAPLAAQVHYHPDGQPWKQRADAGPDAEVPGWYYNLGTTGLRVELTTERPETLLVRHVFADTPAAGKLEVGDRIVGAGGTRFETAHRNGYGMDVFGPRGPLEDFALALEASQGAPLDGRLALTLERAGELHELRLEVGCDYVPFAPTWPADCARSERMRAELVAYLAAAQGEDGSWGSPPRDTFAPLALLASGEPRYLPLVEKSARWHARTTSAVDDSWLINWRYCAAAIVLSEYHLATGAEWVIPELQQIYDFLISSQFTDSSQIDAQTKLDRPEDLPRTDLRAKGGWGHNPGFEGYGPIAMLTGQGALAFALMQRCGIEVDRERHDAAYAFLERGTGSNGYLWYADEVAGDEDWADMGRTGASALAFQLSPYPEQRYREQAARHAKLIGLHPESFPDTHGAPLMGMGYAALAAHIDATAFRRLMDANRWWFVLAQCPDGSFHYQPNRDNAGYGSDARLAASAVTALMLSIPKSNLHITGKPFRD